MLNYREITVFDAIANTQILLPDLLRIVHQKRKRRLFFASFVRHPSFTVGKLMPSFSSFQILLAFWIAN
jgi:hypothetical protein